MSRSESGRYFIDTCVFIYAVGREHPYRVPCVRLVEAIGGGHLSVLTDTEVIQEIAHRFYCLDRRADGVQWARDFAELVPDILSVTRQEVLRSLDVMQAHPSLAPRDAIHVAVMQNAGIQNIITANRHFDDLPGIVRVDPAEVEI